MRAMYRWLTGQALLEGEPRVSEAVWIRGMSLFTLGALLILTFTSTPHPALSGIGLRVLLATLAFIACAVAAIAINSNSPPHTRTLQLALVLVGAVIASDLMADWQPNGFWYVGPYFVAILAAWRLDTLPGLALVAFSLSGPVIGSAMQGHTGTALTLPSGVIPWYLVMRLFAKLRDQRDELDASRSAEARAAAAAERSRMAREMHDVLAHSLSALALQLESTRLLARDRDVDPEVARAIDRAHGLAASGLDDARRAIAAARGDELPGPERLEALATAFGDQSGVPVAVEVHGEPHELPADARVALYRTAQEALTNVRRHADAERVRLSLDYTADRTVLVVEDHGAPGAPPPLHPDVADSGYGLTGMRERAALLGGELLAAPTLDGFRVELRLPK